MAMGIVACAAEDFPQDQWNMRHTKAAPSRPSDNERPNPGTCEPARSAEQVPARIAVISGEVATGSTQLFVSDLFASKFKPLCGACHVEGSQGDIHVTSSSFVNVVDQTFVDAIFLTDPMKMMPPLNAGGKLASTRAPEDPVLELAHLLQLWIDQGRPSDVILLPRNTANGASPYLMSEDVGEALTAIGNCIPSKEMIGTQTTKMDALDAAFARLARAPKGEGSLVDRIGLPERLEDTDLFTLDSATLARHGVVTYAPIYPLWADNARKIRHVRVPRGKSIRFNKDTQTFDIPPNTRFYKTFLKRIIDEDGNESYRKMETRLIVARPDVQNPDGTTSQMGLFGTYIWNEDETEATLFTEPLRNGEPFTDSVISYITNAPIAEQVTGKHPRNLTLKLTDAGVIRHYAVPGSDRCIQCHMGSSSHDFVLGFTPLQTRRRPPGEGGVIEASNEDEMNQLDRLIEYGIITGLDRASDIIPLEESQGERKPRNNYELVAQGYMVGNCAYCHNPRGFASVRIPVLTDLLNLSPSLDGGIFQFPLERMSPRITRGLGGSVRIPYITPSLVDYPAEPSRFYTPKYGQDAVPNSLGRDFILAPWRSLIYRNVDTPFTYADDAGLFPHMPMNTPGFDCRGPRILGDWMVSIPGVRKKSEIPEYLVGSTDPSTPIDTSEQPYVEIKLGEDGYEDAVNAAARRLNLYHSGPTVIPNTGESTRSLDARLPRFDYCPDQTDIVDADVLRDPDNVLVPHDRNIYDSNLRLIMPADGVPDNAHWVVTDLTDAQGDWYPRRADWKDLIVDKKIPSTDTPAASAEKRLVIDLLQSSTLDQTMTEFAALDVPIGLWTPKDACDFSAVKKVSDVKADATLAPFTAWTEESTPPPDDAPVYFEKPGEAVFNTICINCHGPRADSQGRQADILASMTGGQARVANMRDGFFGPPLDPGANRNRVFGVPGLPGGADDMAARYFSFMALGGTDVTIPAAILNIVSNTDILGVKRPNQLPVTDANMLSVALGLCTEVVAGTGSEDFDPKRGWFTHDGALIWTNGDGELWKRLCSLHQSPPVRVLFPLGANGFSGQFPAHPAAIRDQAHYPSDAPVGTDRGTVTTGIAPDNLMPWCLQVDPGREAAYDDYVSDPNHLIDGKPLPICPKDWLSQTPGWSQEDFARWNARGAINAGAAVFLYLDGVVKGKIMTQPRYDQCELLGK
jgi:mono/diheme cytochrome c family protein